MRVLLVHNYYQRAGGEDYVFQVERDILAEQGHAVETLTLHNDAVEGLSATQLAASTVWSRAGRRAVEAATRRHRADVVHFHNTLPLVSPAGYVGARAAGAAVVQTLHNYRLVCPAATLFRDGQVCESCVGKAFATPSIVHACYRGSRTATAAVATATAVHRALGTWERAVDRYIAITDFARERIVAGGLPADRIAVKPNTIAPVPVVRAGGGGYAYYAARFDPGKGLDTLIRAWSEHADLPPLIVAGDGELAPRVREAAERLGDRFRWVGWLEPEKVRVLADAADLYLFPSEMYEGGNPISLLEALAMGLPVVASGSGTVRGMLQDGREGRLFPPGDSTALAEAVREVWADSAARTRMGEAARATFEQTYSPRATYEMLSRIYDEAIAERHRADA